MKKLLLPLVIAIVLIPANAYGCELFYNFLSMFKPAEQTEEYEPPRRRTYKKPQQERKVVLEQPSPWKTFQEKSVKKPVVQETKEPEPEVSKVNWKFWEPKNRGLEDRPVKIIRDERFTTQPIAE